MRESERESVCHKVRATCPNARATNHHEVFPDSPVQFKVKVTGYSSYKQFMRYM